MTISAWFPLVWRNRLAIHPFRLPMALIISSVTLLNSFLAAVQRLLFDRKIQATQIQDDPIFIVGHWRSGTTLLHELLVLDSRHTYPNTYECFAPNHFLASGGFLPAMLGFLMPKQRPMDSMAAGWQHPQEDEFAMCAMGVPSPYLTMLFPNRPPQYPEYLTLEKVAPADVARWKQKLLWFLKCVTVRRPKRIVLKSPPHTCRIKALLELFPDARFVHIVRDPFVVFLSTVNLWKQLYKAQGLQVPRFEGLEEQVLDTFCRMYQTFERDRQLIDPSRYCEVRYEDLVGDIIGQMEKVYQQLGLGEFDNVLPALQTYVAEHAHYKTNRWDVAPELRARIAQRWSTFCEKYGYGAGANGESPSPQEAQSAKSA
jgi:hypothetical protein